MKKLIGIIAAVAMAASVFALNDATTVAVGGVKIGDGDSDAELFEYWKDGAEDATTTDSFKFAVKDTPIIEFDIDLGKVGGHAKLRSIGGDERIWFKPFDLEDLLKISVGNGVGAEFNLCGVEKFGDVKAEAKTINTTGNGFRIDSKPLDALTLYATLSTGDTKWWTVDGQYAASVGAQYTDDTVGTVKAFWSTTQKGEKQNFGLGWTKSFGSITPIVNVIGYANEWTKTEYDKNSALGYKTSQEAGISKFVIEPTVKGSMDPLTWSVYVPVEFDFAAMSYRKYEKAQWNDLPDQTAKDKAKKENVYWYQPKIGVAAKVDYKIADDGYLTGAHLYAGVPYVNAFNNLVALQFEAGVNGKISDNTSWSLTVSPTIVTFNTDRKGDSFISNSKGKFGVTNPDKGAKADDDLDSLFNIVVYPKLSGNYGGMSWNIGVKFETGRKIATSALLDPEGTADAIANADNPAEKAKEYLPYSTTKVSVPFMMSISF